MKHLLFILSLAIALPLYANSDFRKSYLDGVWKDRYHHDRIEIQDKRKGLEVKRKGLFRKKRLFKEVSYNRFVDYDGNIIEVLSENKIVWKNRRNRMYKSFYKHGYAHYDNYRNRYDDRFDRRFNQDRGRYGDNRRYIERYDRRNRRGIEGRWRCADNKRDILIESVGNGFRVRHFSNDRWDLFNRDPYESNVYRSNNGEKYLYKDNSLTWYGRNACDIVRFGRY